MLYKYNPRDVVQLLLDYGWSRKGIAREIGVSQPTISRIASGKRLPRRETNKKLLAFAELESKKISALRERLISMLSEGI